MKKIAFFALLALLFTNCKQNNSEQELESAKTPADTIAKEKIKEETPVADEDCKDIEVEMGSGRECIIKNTDINQVYLNIIKNKEVDESEYYLSTLPTEKKSVEVNKDGLMSIDYEITKDKVAISMNYAGGVTEVTLEKIDNTVKRSIYHYAD
jgi:cell envelope opacity-associated protein A